MKRSLLILFLVCMISGAKAQQGANLWMFLPETPDGQGEPRIQAVDKRLYQLGLTALKQTLLSVPNESSAEAFSSTFIISLPDPSGHFQQFRLVESSVMQEGLQARYPEIRTYLGQGVTDGTANLRMDITPHGFHAMVISARESYFIDPYYNGTTGIYIVYYRKDFRRPISKVMTEGQPEPSSINLDSLVQSMKSSGILTPNGGTRRTFRLAVATSKEYTNFHGGTVPLGLSAVVTSVNRVVGVYEREFAVRLTLIANNDLVIYTDINPGPWTNQSSASTTITQNQTNMDAVIGSANYDIGHVFTTGAGGLASLGSVCSGFAKARGVTGISAPVGDPFDIDYVAHEMGHQFGGSHTFNGSTGNCLTEISTSHAWEPGSGSTIMAYADLCPGQNIQSNSDAYFHTGSYEQMLAFIQSINFCPVQTTTGNNPPNASVPFITYTIPRGTPFSLTGTGSDPNPDTLTFNWEQIDLGPQGAPNSPSGQAPVFRSVKPDTSRTRFFPSLSFLRSNASTAVPLGEALANYGRTLGFRFTVRDNRAGSGGVNNSSTYTVTVASEGPVTVTQPTSTANQVFWTPGQSRTVSWTVNNTNLAPVAATDVNIEFSLDDGVTWPITLVSNTPNDGTENVIVPNITTNNGRVRVVSVLPNIWFAWARTRVRITAVAGVNEQVDLNKILEVFPNPAKDILYLVFDNELIQPDRIELFDLLGKQVKLWNKMPDHDHSGELRLPLDELNTGLYMLSLHTSDGKHVSKKIYIQP